MKFFRLAALVPTLLLTAIAASPAATLGTTKPYAVSARVDARSICHHLRWSSKRNCTSEQTLRFVARPPLYYPSRYFADRPHYYYEQRRYFWHMWNAQQRFYGWPYRYYWY